MTCSPGYPELIDDLINDRQEFADEPDRVKNLVREAAGRFLQTEARRRPTIVPVLLEF